MTGCVYRSTHPDVLASWEDTQRRHREFGDTIAALRAEFPEHKVIALRTNDRAWFSHIEPQEDDPHRPPTGEGWRMDKKLDGWVPDKRTRAGKALAERFGSLRVEKMGDLPGMPTTAMGDGRWYSHGVLAHEGVIYAHWGCGFDTVEAGLWGGKVDAGLWERGRLSGFYAAKEAKEEQA